MACGEEEEIGRAVVGEGIGGGSGEADAIGDEKLASPVAVGLNLIASDDNEGEPGIVDGGKRLDGLAEALTGEVLGDHEGHNIVGGDREALSEAGCFVVAGLVTEVLEIDGVEKSDEAVIGDGGIVPVDLSSDVIREAEDEGRAGGGEQVALH